MHWAIWSRPKCRSGRPRASARKCWSDSMASVPVAKLNQQSEEYTLYSGAWMDFDLLAAGGARLKAAVTRFLAKRPKELPDVYAERCKRLTYQNILGQALGWYCLLYTSDAADERSSVDLGGRRIIK